jgi:transposase-like protein
VDREKTVLSEKFDGCNESSSFLRMTSKNLFKYFKTSPEIVRLAVMFYVRYPLSYRQVEDILNERGVI